MHRLPKGRTWLGRTYTDAPDVDGNIWVKGTHLTPGDLVACEIVAAGYDLVAARASAQPVAPRPVPCPDASQQPRRW